MANEAPQRHLKAPHGFVHNIRTLARKWRHDWRRSLGLSEGKSRRELLIGHGDACGNVGDWASAVQYYQVALNARESPRVHAKLARAYRHLKDFEDAIRHYESALELNPMQPVERKLPPESINKICTSIIDCCHGLIGEGAEGGAKYQEMIKKYSAMRDGLP